MRVQTFPRDEFLADYWRYRSGEHATFMGPTGCGKTHTAYQLMEISATARRPAVVLVMKPRDNTVRDFTRRAGYRVVRHWPPGPSIWHPRRPPGYVLWPRHRFDPQIDDPALYDQFRRALLDSYKRGDRIVFADEVYGLARELRLERELITVWSRGRSMGAGLWSASQRPAMIPLWAYSQAEHLFIWRDPDKRARIRYAEIGGVDPDLVQSTVMDLATYQALYIRRTGRHGPVMCVVDA